MPLHRLALALVVALLSSGCAGSPEAKPAPAPPDTDPPDTVDRSISRFLTRTLPEGASGTLVAARGDDLVHCAGFGMADREDEIAADCDTGYDVMSMTKQFTAAAIVKLETMGRLDVRDRIGTYLGDVPEDKQSITVHQLLTHTGGLVEALGGDYEPLSRDDMIAAAMGSKLISTPGSEHHYSNVGYSLLAAIVEITSGMAYEDFLDEYLFEPAGMTSTGYVRPHWDANQVAVEYDADGTPQGRPYEHAWADDGPYWNLKGNGGLISTARDMYRWHVALEGTDVLDRAAKAQLFRPYVAEEPGGGSYYGYGWVVQDTDFGKVVGHDGGNEWSYGEIVRLPDTGEMIFWITNQYKDTKAGYNLSRLAPKVTLGVAQRLIDR